MDLLSGGNEINLGFLTWQGWLVKFWQFRVCVFTLPGSGFIYSED